MTSPPRDPRTGRWLRSVPNVDAESRFNPMGDEIPFENISGAPSPNTVEQRRQAPVADDSGGRWPAHTLIAHRQAVLVHPDDEGYHNGGLRTAARTSGAMDPSAYLTGVDHGLDPEQQAEAIARQQTPAQVQVIRDATNPYTISRAVPRDPAGEYAHDELFSTTRKYAGLEIDTGRISGSHVVTVSDEPDQMDDALRAAGADLLGQQYPYARAGFVRRALRPASRAEGRGRWR